MVAYKPPKCGLFWWKFWLILAYPIRLVWGHKLLIFVLKNEKFCLRQHFFIFIFFNRCYRLQFLGQGSMCLLPISNSLTSPLIRFLYTKNKSLLSLLLIHFFQLYIPGCWILCVHSMYLLLPPPSLDKISRQFPLRKCPQTPKLPNPRGGCTT